MGRYMDIVNEFLREKERETVGLPTDGDAKKAKKAKKAPRLAHSAKKAPSGCEKSPHGIPLSELRQLAGDDWPEIEADPELLETFAHAVRTRRMREAGEIPPEYTQPAECAGCGPVLLWNGAPERVEACPWCFNRLRGFPVPEERK